MHRPRPCLGYPQVPSLPRLGHTLSQLPPVFPPSADSLRRDRGHLLQPQRHAHIPTYNHGYWRHPSLPISHGTDHFSRRSFFSSACNLADISVDETRTLDHQNFRIPYPTVSSFPNIWTRPEGNNNVKVPTLTAPTVTTRFRRSITVPSLGTRKTSDEQLTTLEEGSDKAVMLKYYQDDEPREPKQKKKRIRKSNSFGSFQSYNAVRRQQTEAKLQSDVVIVSNKRHSGFALEQLKHLGQEIASAQTRREPIQVCTEQDILTRDESDGTPPLVIDLPDDLLPIDYSRPKPKTHVRPSTPPALERSEYIENGLESRESIGEKNNSSPRSDIDESPPLVIDIPGTSDSEGCLNRSTLGNIQETPSDIAQETGQSQPGLSELTTVNEASTGQTGTGQTTEYQQAAHLTQTSERAQQPPYWQTTESVRDTHQLQRLDGPQAGQFQTPEYHQASFMEQEDLIQRTTRGPSTNSSSIAATLPSYPVLGPKFIGLTADDMPLGKYKCIRCSKSFPSVQALLRHRIMCLAKICATDRFTCTQCNETFTSTKASSDHWKEYHSTERQHVCHKCGRRFTLARALEKHSWTHK